MATDCSLSRLESIDPDNVEALVFLLITAITCDHGDSQQQLIAYLELARPPSKSHSNQENNLECFARFGHAQQDLEQQQPALQIHSDEEILLGMLASVLSQLDSKFRMGK